MPRPSSTLVVCLFTSSRFVRFNVSRTGARGGIIGEDSGFAVSFGFAAIGFLLMEAIEEKDEPAEVDKSRRSKPSLVVKTVIIGFADDVVFGGDGISYPFPVLLFCSGFL